MLTTPKKKSGTTSVKRCSSDVSATRGGGSSGVKRSSVTVFENGTLEGAVQSATPFTVGMYESASSLSCVQVPKIVITSSNGDICDTRSNNSIEALDENTSLLLNRDDANIDDVLNRSSSDSNILESSIFSEVHLPQSVQQQSQTDTLNNSTCSRDSRQSKKSRRKSKKCNSLQMRTAEAFVNTLPPQYTAIFLDPSANSGGLLSSTPIEQIAAAAAAASPFLDRHHHQIMSTLPASGGHRSTPDTSPVRRGCFRKWFSRPSLPFVIGILALGGVACTLGGIVLGSTGLIEHSTQYLSAALLMIGIGVSLLVISGAIWRLSIPDEVDECPCFRHIENCRNCNSPYCNNRILPGGYHLYPEFQHRPPPPSYLTSLNECAVGLLFHRDMTSALAQHPQFRINTPPPVYRSTNSLSACVPVNVQIGPPVIPPNAQSTLETVVTGGFESSVPKEMTYLELD